MGQQERKAETTSIEVFADLVGQLKEQTSQAGGDCIGQGDSAGILQGKAVLLTDTLDGTHLGLFMGAQEGLESLALDGTELGGGERFSRNLIDAVGENRIQAQHGARSGYTDDHLAILKVSNSEF